jgi:Putative zinc-finger
MNTMTCNDIAEQIELFAAGECDPPVAAAIRRHMAGCAHCARAENEARQFLGLMDLRLQEPDRLQRLLDRIDNDADLAPPIILMTARATPVRTASRSSRQRWFAIAASILLPIGIGIWLSPPADSPAPEQARMQLTVALLPDRSSRAHEKVAAPDPVVDDMDPKAALSFHLQTASQTSKQYRSNLLEAAFTGRHTAPPEVDLLLQIENPTDRPIRVRFDDPRAELRFVLSGPSVLRLDAPPDADPFAGLRLLDVAGNSAKAVPIRRLIGGSRQRPIYLYWTEPGKYRLRPVLHVPIEAEGKTTLTTISGPTLLIRVK